MIHRCPASGCRGRHWTRGGVEACIESQPAGNASHFVRRGGPGAWQQDRLDAKDRREQQAFEERIAAHVPSPPVNAVAHRNGERQLLDISGQITTAAALTSKPMYRLNRQLRSGKPQTVDDILTMFAGFDSYADFESAAADLFATLGSGVRLLDGPITVYRGTRTDILSTWLPGKTVSDAGYLFAAMDQATARLYTHVPPWDTDPNLDQTPALLELEVHSALVIPGPAERSQSLMTAVGSQTFLENSIAQIVVPPTLNKWHVTGRQPEDYLYVQATQL